MYFVLMLALFQGALMIARYMAGEIANLSVRYAGKVTGFGMTAAAWGGRRSVGWGAGKISRYFKDKEKSGKTLSGTERMLSRMSSGLARSSLDVRGTRVGKALQGAVSMGTGERVDFGRPSFKGGYEAIREERIKKEVEKAGAFASTESKKAYAEDIAKGGIIARLFMRKGVREEVKQRITDPIRKKELSSRALTLDNKIKTQKELVEKLEAGKPTGIPGLRLAEEKNKLGQMEKEVREVRDELKTVSERHETVQKSEEGKQFVEALEKAMKKIGGNSSSGSGNAGDAKKT